MNAALKFWTNAKKAAGASVVAEHVKERLDAGGDFVVEAYHKGGFEVRLEIPLSAPSWPESVYELIVLSQRLARVWTLSSTIEDECYLTSNDVPVPGVTAAHICIIREQPKASEPTPTSQRG